jgi:two-component system, NarL family, sensor kinase
VTAEARRAALSGLPSPRAVVAVGGVSAVVGICAAGCVLLALNVAAGAPADDGPSFWPMQVVAALAYGGLGGWLLARHTAGALGPLFLLVSATQALSLFCREYGVHSLQVGPALPLDRWVFWTHTWIWVPGFLSLFLLVPLVLPDGALPSRRWRPAVVCTAVTLAVAAVSWAITPYAQLDGPALDATIGSNPVVVPVAAARLIDAVSVALLLLSAGLALAALTVRWRRADADKRRATAWVLYGAALSGVFVLVAILTDVMEFVGAVGVAILPACCLVALARHPLWDLHLVVRRSLVYGGLTAAVAAAYAGVVGLVGGAAGASTGAPIVATAVVAMLVLPLHHLLRRVVNRIVYGQPEDPYVTTSRLSQRLGSAVAPDQVTTVVLPEILAGVVRALQLRHLSLAMADGRSFAFGTPVPDPVELPLRHAGRLVGVLRVGPAHGGLTRSERRAIEDVAAQAAVAVHGVLLMGELQRERERVIAAREEERRRLRRELHDGVGTALAAACLQAEAANHLLAENVEDGRALLTRLGEQLREAVVDVRAVTRNLRPAMLDELGLVGALRELGARSSGPERPVDVEVGELGDVPAAVEVAAYMVVAELVTNACRHSAASRVLVAAGRHDGDLSVRVSDNGCGIDPDAVAGVGLGSVRRRVEEVGGRLEHRPGPGTTIEAWLPLESR